MRPAVFSVVALLGLTAAAPLGDWFTEDKGGVIHIGACGAAICGEIAGVSKWRPDGSAPLDINGVSQCHLRIIRDMRPGDDNRLHGTVTDPRDGKVYQAELWLGSNDVLNLRGYIGLPLLGSTQHWSRFTGKLQADCHFSTS